MNMESELTELINLLNDGDVAARQVARSLLAEVKYGQSEPDTHEQLEAKMKGDLIAYYYPISDNEDLKLLHLGAEFGVKWALENLIDNRKL